MDRKTNLFYNADSQDSNFLTFSNYTESLTGNFLSTDTKLFPSTFLCLKMPKLYGKGDEASEFHKKAKQYFVQEYLISRYENKLAFLRDYCKKENDLVESRLLPLNYLLEYIYDYDPDTEITYVDNITEQDYNGTFTDTICLVNSTKFKHATLEKDDKLSADAMYADYKYTDTDKQRYKYCDKYLYGWFTKGTELYRNSFDMNNDGHVDRDDYEEFINTDNKDRILKCIAIEHPEWKDNNAKLEAEYAQECTEIEQMVLHNETVYNEAQPTGPKFTEIKEEVIVTPGECTCPEPHTCCKIVEGTDICCCKQLNTTTEIRYVSKEDETHEYLVPKFDYPIVPIRDRYLTEDLYNEAVAQYEKADKFYKITSELTGISLEEENEIVDSNSIQTIEFNVIIPLYDVIDMNAVTNSYIIDETNYIELQNDEADPCLYIKDVPMGIWFSGPEPIILKRDVNTKYCPTWSLVIGSQFKPFPMSQEMPNEITSSAKADAFMTFAQILTKQNDLIDKMSNLFMMMNNINTRMNDLEANLASTGTSYNIDGLHQDIINLEQYFNNQITDIKNTLAERDLVWVNREG